MDASSGNWWWWWWWPSSDDAQSNASNDEAIRSEKGDEALSRRILIIILSLANVTSSLLASIISYAIFANTIGPPLAMEFSHRWLFSLTMFVACSSSISCFSSTIQIFANQVVTSEPEASIRLKSREDTKE